MGNNSDNYFSELDQYLLNEMSDKDKLAFELKVKKNSKLKEELDQEAIMISALNEHEQLLVKPRKKIALPFKYLKEKKLIKNITLLFITISTFIFLAYRLYKAEVRIKALEEKIEQLK